MKVQVKIGSEWHTTERRSAQVRVNGLPIYDSLKPNSRDWELVGNKGKHGKWCVAEYEIPVGTHVQFRACANGKNDIVQEFVVHEGMCVDVEGYRYGDDICGWIVTIQP